MSERGRQVTVYMLPQIEAALRVIGEGNLSGGIKKAVEEYNRLSKQGVQARKAKRAKK